MGIIITPPMTTPPTASIPRHMSVSCPFCDCEKEVRFDTFKTDDGQIVSSTMTISSYNNLVRNNKTQPDLDKLSKVVECYCPQCYISFSICRSVGVW